MKKRYLLTLLALAVSTLPVLICASLYFPVWSNRSAGATLSGLGLMIGVETERPVGDVLKECIEQGILPIKAKNKLRLLPALNIPMEDLKRAVEIIKAVAKNK